QWRTISRHIGPSPFLHPLVLSVSEPESEGGVAHNGDGLGGDWNPIAIPAPHSPRVLLVLLQVLISVHKVWAEQWSEGDGGKTRRWEWESSSIDDQLRAPRHASLTPACVAGTPRFDCLGIIREVHHLASSRLDWTSRSGRNTLRQTQKPPRPEGSNGGGLHAINKIQTKVDLLKYCHGHNIKVPPSPLLSSPGTLPHLDEDGVTLLFEDIHLGRSVILPHAVPVKPTLVKWDAARPLGCR
ncbi:hypothetical protein B0H14DRAFT_3504309, partial [Mycena olivaceomarginata]